MYRKTSAVERYINDVIRMLEEGEKAEYWPLKANLLSLFCLWFRLLLNKLPPSFLLVLLTCPLLFPPLIN